MAKANTHKTPRPTEPFTRAPRSPYFATLEKVKGARSGEWREIARFKSPRGASDALGKIRNRIRPIPAGRWRFATERITGVGSRLSASYIGEGDEIAWYRGGELITEVPAAERRAKSKAGKQRAKK